MFVKSDVYLAWKCAAVGLLQDRREHLLMLIFFNISRESSLGWINHTVLFPISVKLRSTATAIKQAS